MYFILPNNNQNLSFIIYKHKSLYQTNKQTNKKKKKKKQKKKIKLLK